MKTLCLLALSLLSFSAQATETFAGVIDRAVGQQYLLQSQECTVDIFNRTLNEATLGISAGRNGEFSQVFVAKRENLSAVERVFYNWAYASTPKMISPDTFEFQEILISVEKEETIKVKVSRFIRSRELGKSSTLYSYDCNAKLK